MFSYIRLFIHHTKEMFFTEQPRWFLWTPVLFAIGVGLYFEFPFKYSIWYLLLLLELFLLIFYLFRKSHFVLFLSSVLFLILVGYTVVFAHIYHLSKSVYPVEEEKIYLKATIENIDNNYRGKQRIVVGDLTDFKDKEIKGKYRLTLISKNENLRVGDCVETVASISGPTKPFLVGGYIPSIQTFFQEISGVGYVSASVFPLDCQRKNQFMDNINNLRIRIENRITAVLPKDEAGVVASIMMGGRGNISNKIKDDYRDSGLAHFLSISGVHMSMIAALTFFLVRFFMALIPFFALHFDGKKISALVSILTSFIYLLISGMEIPAQRAFVMTSIVLLGVLVDRNPISMRVLAVSVFAILFIAPEALIGPSFQMSFAAVVALIAFYERFAGSIHRFWQGSDYRKNNLFTKTLKVIILYFIGILFTDFVASATTSVYAIYHFNRLAIYTTITNTLSGPVIGFIVMPFMLFSLVLMPFGLDRIPLEICGWGVKIVNHITSEVAGLPNASVFVPSFPLWGMLLMTFGGLWLCLWQQKWRNWGWILILIGVLSVFSVTNPDIIINEDAKAIALKQNNEEMLILPSRGNYVLKKVWLEKTASYTLTEKQKKELKQIYSGKKENLDWIDLSCNETYCDYKERIRIFKDRRLYDIKKNTFFDVPSGGSVWIEKNDLKIRTIDEYMKNKAYK